MNEFTFYFKFTGKNNSSEAIHGFNIKSINLKEAVKVWTNYVQSAQNMIELCSIEKNGRNCNC